MTSDNSNSNDCEAMTTECAQVTCAHESHSVTDEKCTNVDQLFRNAESHCISFVLEKHMLPSIVKMK